MTSGIALPHDENTTAPFFPYTSAPASEHQPVKPLTGMHFDRWGRLILSWSYQHYYHWWIVLQHPGVRKVMLQLIRSPRG